MNGIDTFLRNIKVHATIPMHTYTIMFIFMITGDMFEWLKNTSIHTYYNDTSE